MLQEVKIKSVSSIDMAKYQGLMGAFIGFIVGIFYSCYFIFFSSIIDAALREASKSNSNTAYEGGLGGLGIGASICVLILAPLFYAALGFVAGYITTGIGNRILGKIGGIRTTVSMNNEQASV
jgi:uncharacterized protein YacL